MNLHAPLSMAITVVVYFAVVVALGLYASRGTKNLADYYIAGRSAPRWVAIISGSAAVMSGFGLVGLPGLAYAYGGVVFFLQVFAILGFSVAAFLVARKLRTLGEIKVAYTIPDAMALRYPSMPSVMRIVGILGLVVGMLGYLSVEFQALGVVLSSLLPVSYWGGVLIGTGIVAIYTIAGGIRAGIWTDLFQFSLEMLAGITVIITVFIVVGNPVHILSVLAQAKGTWAYHAAPWWPKGAAGLGVGAAIAWTFEFGLGHGGQPQLLTKYYVHRKASNTRYQALGNGITYSLAALMIFSGLGLAALTAQHRAPLLSNPDYAAPYFFIHYIPTWLSGIVFTALIAASMATVNGFSNIASAAITRDFMQGILHRQLTPRRGLMWGRIWTLVLLLIALWFTYSRSSLIGIAGTEAWGLLAAVFFPAVALGLNWRRGNSWGVVASGVIGVVGGTWVTVANWNPGGFFGIAIIMAASMVAYVLVSAVTRPERLDEAVAAVVEMGRSPRIPGPSETVVADPSS
ncbi:MAG: sodium/proline symporter [Thermaerobacter sp.]|nr:sodium/proline symporter [Thermaerobacter sp.]